jgi:cellulose biosynthesis protein BcsQ
LTLFNHKGGVGKTTLTVNVARALTRLGKRVLLVDSDPQGNLTSLLVEESVVNQLLDQSDSPGGQTIWSAVKPIVDGSGDVQIIPPVELPDNLFLLPGDIRLAEFEQELTALWGECFQRRPRGFRGTTALSSLVNHVAHMTRADFVMYDSGPNIGALNRVIMLDCDFFAIPAACDLFSIRAIATLGQTLSGWIRNWATLYELAARDVYLLPGRPKLIGYIPQRYKTYGDRISKEYARFLPRIELAVQKDVIELLRRVDESLVACARSPLSLGGVKDFASLAAASQREGVAIPEVHAGTPEQREVAEDTFDDLAAKIIERTAH